METPDDTTVEQPLPSWVLRTPTRQREVWTLPAFLLALASALVVLGVVIDRAGGVVNGVLLAAGAAALAIAGRRAFAEQTVVASWRFHIVGVVVGFGVVTVLTIGSLVAGVSVGTAAGVLGAGSQVFRNARSVPRFDRLVAAASASFIGLTAAVLVVLGLVLPTVPAERATVWVGVGWIVAVVAAVIAVVQFRVASRAPRD